MDEIPGTSAEKPMWMAIMPQPPKPRDVIILTIVSLAPVALALLMQKPALRQAMKMKLCHTVKVSSQMTADFFQVIADNAASEYARAKL